MCTLDGVTYWLMEKLFRTQVACSFSLALSWTASFFFFLLSYAHSRSLKVTQEKNQIAISNDLKCTESAVSTMADLLMSLLSFLSFFLSSFQAEMHNTQKQHASRCDAKTVAKLQIQPLSRLRLWDRLIYDKKWNHLKNRKRVKRLLLLLVFLVLFVLIVFLVLFVLLVFLATVGHQKCQEVLHFWWAQWMTELETTAKRLLLLFLLHGRHESGIALVSRG